MSSPTIPLFPFLSWKGIKIGWGTPTVPSFDFAQYRLRKGCTLLYIPHGSTPGMTVIVSVQSCLSAMFP